MNFKRRYKTLYLFGHPTARTWVISKLRGHQYYFPENFRCSLKIYKRKNIFFIPFSLTCFFNPKNFRFPFSTRNSLTWGMQNAKIVHEWNSHLDIFSLPQAIENSRQFLLLRTDFLQKTVVGCPWLICAPLIKWSVDLRHGCLVHFVYNLNNVNYASSFQLEKLINANEKIAELCQTNMPPKHYIKRYKQQKWTLKSF